MAKIFLRFWLVVWAAMVSASALAESEWKAFSTPGGQPALPLALPDMTGKTIDLATYKGQVVVINFWATWCEPCRDEMPSMNRLQHQLAGKPFRVVGINIGEGKPRIEQFLKHIPVDFTILLDADAESMKAWRVRILPASFLIDKNGLLRYQLVGDANWADAKIQMPILELLK